MRVNGASEVVHQADNHEAWLAARRELITASDVSRLLGIGWAKSEDEAKQQRGQLVMEKAGLAEGFAGNETTDIGTELELPLLQIAGKRMGLTIEPCGMLMKHPTIARLGATPDAFIVTRYGKFPVNAKVTSAQPPEQCKPRRDGKPSEATYANGLPLYHRTQALAEAMVCGASHGAMAVLHCAGGLTLRLYLQPRHEKLEARIEAEVASAWREIETLRAGKLSEAV
jgi:hypothetical protein